MKWSTYILTLLVLAALTVLSVAVSPVKTYSGVAWYVWLVLAALSSISLALWLSFDTRRTRFGLRRTSTTEDAPGATIESLPLSVVDPDGPKYPHPVINTQTCIGCHACVDACPHDVLKILNGKAALVAVEQCMEDTSCEVECPTVPKSCVVHNTTKKIPARKVPQRDQRFCTNVPGIFLIGDVSGVPLIKNAINEGGAVVDFVAGDLENTGGATNGDYDLAIIGLGPAGLSAVVTAHQRGLKYVALDQEQVLATIQQTYQAGKYVYFNPVDQVTQGGIGLEGPGSVKEDMVRSWLQVASSNKVVLNEYESCKSIKPADGGFIVATEKELAREKMEYRVRRVVLAIGNRGTPMKLRAPGEDLKIRVTPTVAVVAPFCTKCGARTVESNRFCQECGNVLEGRVPEPFDDEKVKFKLSDPKNYQEKHVMIVGAGNSAIEAAIDLAAFRSADGTAITGWRDNHVSLVVRSDFKGDLKLGNKMLAYDCIDAGRIKAFFGMTIKEITPDEVILMSARERDPKTAKETARVKNDYVFAMIGGEKPTKFLESLGIKIG